MPMLSHITTDRLSLRPFQAQDLDGYVGYYTSDARTQGVGGAKPRHVVVERFYAMAGQWAIKGYGRYAIALRETDPAFGHVGVMHIDGAPEMTWTLWDETKTGHGYASEAAKAALDSYLSTEADAVIAHIEPDNTASIKVAERIGMTQNPKATPPSWFPSALCYEATA